MGLSFGGSGGGTTASQSVASTGTDNASKNYSGWQTALQQLLGNTFSKIIGNVDTGVKSPGVQAQQNASADQINQNYSGLQDRTNRFLASRGFGKSGAVGSSQLKTELSRQGALAGNSASYSGIQDQQNQGYLSDALSAAFNAMGLSSTETKNQNTNQNSNSWGFGGGFGASVPGFGK